MTRHQDQNAGAEHPSAFQPLHSQSNSLIAIGVFLFIKSLLLAGVILVVFGHIFHAPFIFDDVSGVKENPSIVKLWPLLGDAQHPGPLNPPHELPTAGRPLVNLTLALNYELDGLNPVGYHLFNLVIHWLSAILLGLIVRRTLRLEYFGDRFFRASELLAFLVALLWAVHPLQTETVVYITQRTELMVGFFYVATLYGSMRYWAAHSPKSKHNCLVLTTLACFAGMACKEVMVTAPVIVLLFDRTFIAGSFRQAWRQSWPLYVGLAASWLLLLALNHSGPRSGTAGFHLGVPPYTWWFTQAKVLWIYLKLVIWPWPLVIHYQIPYLDNLSAAWPWLLLTGLLLATTLALLWRRYSAGFVGAWMLLILSPTFIVPIITEVAAERRMYLPLAALVTLSVVGGYTLLTQAAQHAVAANTGKPFRLQWTTSITAAIVLALAILLSLVSVRRVAVYNNPILLWQNAVDAQPDNYIAYNNWGTELGFVGRLDESIEKFQQALRLKPDYIDALENLALACIRAGRPQQAIEPLQISLRLRPENAQTQHQLGLALAHADRPQDAVAHFQEAIKLRPQSAEFHYDLGTALLQTGHAQEAIDHFQEAVRLKTDFVVAYVNLGFALMTADRTQEALQYYEQALKLEPDNSAAYAKLALAYARLHSTQNAIAAAEKALELAKTHGQTVLAQQITKWLTDYRLQTAKEQNKPVAKEPSE